MSFRYAQINKDGRVIGDSYLSGKVSADNMIPILDDFDITNKKYINGEWIEYTPEPEPEPPISEKDKIQAEILLNQCNMLINQENQDKVLAELLLNQLGV